MHPAATSVRSRGVGEAHRGARSRITSALASSRVVLTGAIGRPCPAQTEGGSRIYPVGMIRHGHAAATLLLLVAASSVEVLARQGTPKPPISQPSIVAPPTWWRTIPLPDGRRFVTDGGLSVDAGIVKPDRLPPLVPANSALLERLLATPHETESTLDQLRPGARPNTFVTPSGVIVNGNYVTLLRSTSVAGRVRLRTASRTSPVVIAVDGRTIGVMMPVQPPRAQ